MKPNSYRDPEAHHITGSNLVRHRSSCERGMHAVNARPPPTALYRRYPSLSDDGQPWFPRARRNADKKITVVNPANERDLSPFFSVRTIALLAIVVIIATLVANA